MAHMIPLVPKEFDPKSDEGVVFNALKKLPDDYYVFHSVSATVVENGVLYERELDFVVANSKKGILCIEAKNGSNINYDGTMRAWKYSSGRIMDHDGPYNQIATAKRARQLASGETALTDKKEASVVTLAATEISEGKIYIA